MAHHRLKHDRGFITNSKNIYWALLSDRLWNKERQICTLFPRNQRPGQYVPATTACAVFSLLLKRAMLECEQVKRLSVKEEFKIWFNLYSKSAKLVSLTVTHHTGWYIHPTPNFNIKIFHRHCCCFHLDLHSGFCGAQLLSRVWLFVTPWPVAGQAPLSMKFSRQGYCLFLTQGSNLCLLHCRRILDHCSTQEALLVFVEERLIKAKGIKTSFHPSFLLFPSLTSLSLSLSLLPASSPHTFFSLSLPSFLNFSLSFILGSQGAEDNLSLVAESKKVQLGNFERRVP